MATERPGGGSRPAVGLPSPHRAAGCQGHGVKAGSAPEHRQVLPLMFCPQVSSNLCGQPGVDRRPDHVQGTHVAKVPAPRHGVRGNPLGTGGGARQAGRRAVTSMSEKDRPLMSDRDSEPILTAADRLFSVQLLTRSPRSGTPAGRLRLLGDTNCRCDESRTTRLQSTTGQGRPCAVRCYLPGSSSRRWRRLR